MRLYDESVPELSRKCFEIHLSTTVSLTVHLHTWAGGAQRGFIFPVDGIDVNKLIISVAELIVMSITDAPSLNVDFVTGIKTLKTSLSKTVAPFMYMQSI